MKKLLGTFLVLVFVASCSSVENATSKWKTPEDSQAGLSEGEKSTYLLNKDSELPKTEEKAAPAKKATKKAKNKAATK